jgi:hypothetical protein
MFRKAYFCHLLSYKKTKGKKVAVSKYNASGTHIQEAVNHPPSKIKRLT